jgi:hypothetical protein
MVKKQPRFRRALRIPVIAATTWLCLQFSSIAQNGQKPLILNLPSPAFVGTPSDVSLGPNVEKLSDKPRPPLMAPDDIVNLAPSAVITSSATNTTPEKLHKLVDGKKDTSEDNIVQLLKGLQYVQFDLGAEREVFAIVFWHSFDSPKVYHEVVVRAADDPDFKVNARTLFNNDAANKAGFGAGTDREYIETHEGRLIDTHGERMRYIRLYSNGSTDSSLNEYLEVEIYGRPPK